MRRAYRVGALGAGLVAAALLVAGCGTGGVASAGDPKAGQPLFLANCGSCHTLSEAGTTGTIGPNLDDAFAFDRKQGYADSTIENVVLDQIRLGSGPIATYTNAKNGKGFTPHTQMPANIVTGQDAVNVAAYVASVAGTTTTP